MKPLQTIWLCACTTAPPSAAPATASPVHSEVVERASPPSTPVPPMRGPTEQLHVHEEASCRVAVTRWPAFVDVASWDDALELATREIADHLEGRIDGRRALCPACDAFEPHAYAFPDPHADPAGMDVRVGGFVVPQSNGRVDVLPLALQMRLWHCGPELEAHAIGPAHARLVEVSIRDEGTRFTADGREQACEPGDDDCTIGCFFSETRAYDLVGRPDGWILVERRWTGAPDDERMQLETSGGRLVIRGCGPVSAF